MNDLKNVNWAEWEGLISYKKSIVEYILDRVPHTIVAVFSGNRGGKCLTYNTKIDTPNGKIEIGKLYEKGNPFDVYAWDCKKVITQAHAPFKKDGIHRCYRIKMSDEQVLECADHHRILTSDNRYLTIEDLLYTYLKNLLVSNQEFCQLIRTLNVLHLKKTILDFQGNYLKDHHLYGERPLWDEDIGQGLLPLQDDVLQHDFALSYEDDQNNKCIYSLLTFLSHVSIVDAKARFLALFFDVLYYVFYKNDGLSLHLQKTFEQQSEVVISDVPLSSADHQDHNQSFLAWDNLLIKLFNGNSIVSINPIPCQDVFDFEVPEYHNYFACDMVHHNTRTVCGNYIPKAIMGMLSNPRFNIMPEDKIRTIRLASESLPNDSESEVQNTVYPALKAAIPASWIKSDITFRRPVMVIKSPLGGGDIPVEFMSYHQTTQKGAGVPRKLVVVDELAPYEFYSEQMPRVMDCNGRIIITVTSIKSNWMYDEIFERASMYIRTPTVIQAYKDYLGMDVPKIEKTDSKSDICVIQTATDDNPMWVDLIKRQNLQISVPEYITKFTDYNDPDTVLMRRYGILKQTSGAIFKDFQWDIHFISSSKYFPDGVPYGWKHGRLIDFHESNPWAVMWLVLSPEDEAFVWQEMNPNPEREIVQTISREVAIKTGDYKSYCDLIDPLAAKMQPSVGTSVVQDLNRCLLNLKRDGIGTGGYFNSWDTKSLRGRDEVKKRLKNARDIGKPFNNKVIENGRTVIKPTLWILDNCKQTALSLKNWRTDDWSDRNAIVTKDPKEKPQQKWSHFCTCLEAAFKHPAFQTPPRQERFEDRNIPQKYYGQRSR